MAVGEGMKFSTPHGIRWFSSQMNKTFTRKQNKSKGAKKLSDFEIFSKLGENKSKAKSTYTSLFDDYKEAELTRSKSLSPVEKPSRIRKKSVNTDALDARLLKKQKENLDYSYVLVEETELEKSARERLMREVKQQNWVESEIISHYESPSSSPSILQRKNGGVATYHDGTHLKSGSLISFAPKVQYCDRLVHMDKDELSRQFCDVLGPGLCTDCTKSQMQQSVIDEHIRSFPNICVSPYVLCVPQESERDSKTPFSVYKECDPLQRRIPSPVSPSHNLKGLKTRPNSCTDKKTRLHDSKYNNDCVPRGSSSTPLEVRFCLESPFSSVCSSRRSSITRYLMESRNEELRTRGEHSDEDVKTEVYRSSRRVRISPVLRSPKADYTLNDLNADSLEANCFSKRSTAPRSSSRLAVARSRSSVCKTPSIERTGKLRELPYWKILIPEPPMMEVGRMNVSIYTPNKIPGIKIFDETFFEI